MCKWQDIEILVIPDDKLNSSFHGALLVTDWSKMWVVYIS